VRDPHERRRARGALLDLLPLAPRARPCSTQQARARERRAVKTLTDQGASRVSFVAKATTIAALRLLAAPDVGRNSPRLPGEFSTYRVKVGFRPQVCKIQQLALVAVASVLVVPPRRASSVGCAESADSVNRS